MTEAELRAARRRGRIGLGVAAVAISVLGLAGPVMLAVTGDPSPVLPYYPLGWVIAIAGWLVWLTSWRRVRRQGGDRPDRPRD
jgi:4-amino-4-deoxy-L-arabinose transferase-like glycosyltransferase